MYHVISKRFDFESSHRLFVSDWSVDRNRAFYGPEAHGQYGHGHNFIAYFVFEGPVSEEDGMMINVTVIKDRIKGLIDSRYDHRYLNGDTPPFNAVVPTPENIAASLLKEVQPLFEDTAAKPVVCHLTESLCSEATAYADGRVERHRWVDFSASRRTSSPHLSDEENEKLFGRAASMTGHGHHYRLRLTMTGEVSDEHGLIFPEAEASDTLKEFHSRFDHRNLSLDFPEFAGMPITTEMLARHFYKFFESRLPLARVKLYENERFFLEHAGERESTMGVTGNFHAAHRLHAPNLSNEENREIFGKCNNPYGHGHQYLVECSISGEVDSRTGTMYRLDDLYRYLDASLEPWKYKHLDMDTDDFEGKVSTGENIITVLWSRLEQSLGKKLSRLRLWETPNNRFTLRREKK